MQTNLEIKDERNEPSPLTSRIITSVPLTMSCHGVIVHLKDDHTVSERNRKPPPSAGKASHPLSEL
jgi:hypothetical protein